MATVSQINIGNESLDIRDDTAHKEIDTIKTQLSGLAQISVQNGAVLVTYDDGSDEGGGENGTENNPTGNDV